MDEKLRNKLWKIVGQYLTEEEIHGLPHIRRVYNYFNLFRKINLSVDKDVLNALEYSVLFHDLGRNICSSDDGNHALESEKMMRKLFRNELSGLSVPNQDWILYAIKNHSTGVSVKKAKRKKDICLSLLVVFDHMDCIGGIGIYRNIIYRALKVPLSPKNDDDFWKERIKDCLDHPKKITIKKIGMKKSSIVECLTYQYCATFHILSPIKHFIKFSFREEIEKKLKVTRCFIEDLIKSSSN